jgi:predicted GNAT family acetyltransferase
MAHEIRRTPDRYELLVDGSLAALADYRDDGEVTVLPHVETDPAFRRQGLAGELVGGVLDELRRQGRQVRPVCPFAVGYVRDHPEYADLVAE